MKCNKILRLKYYVELAFKKPYLILRFIFKHHIGVIFVLPIRKNLHETNNSKKLNI